MSTLLLRPLRQLAQTLTARVTPRQIALGFALGMLVGMVPKTNLVALGLGVLLCALRVSQPAGLLSLGLFSLASPRWDAFADRVGKLVLEWEAAQGYYVDLYERACGPYIGFHNTVVVGQLLLGIYFFYPVYHLVHVVASRVQPPLSKWLLSYRAIRWLRGAEIGAQWGIES